MHFHWHTWLENHVPQQRVAHPCRDQQNFARLLARLAKHHVGMTILIDNGIHGASFNVSLRIDNDTFHINALWWPSLAKPTSFSVLHGWPD